MKSILLSLVLIALPLAGHASDRLLLQAIRIKEGGTRQGLAGERGPFQLMPKTVQDAGGTDYAAAYRHLQWIKRNLAIRGLDTGPFNCALSWNAGLERATHGQAKLVSYQYAQDVTNLYDGLVRSPSSLQLIAALTP